MALMAGLVAVLVLGGASAFAISSQQSGAAPTTTRTPSANRVLRTADVVPDRPAGTTRADSRPVESPLQPPPAVQSADPASAPSGPSNNLTVQMSPSSKTHPASQDVQLVLQGYFDAINQHNYSSWTQSVTDAMESGQNSGQWLQAYATTIDSSIWMVSMRDDPLQVTLRFTSQQDADLAPQDLQVPCIDWTLTYQIVRQDDRLVVGSTVPGSVTMVKCAG